MPGYCPLSRGFVCKSRAPQKICECEKSQTTASTLMLRSFHSMSVEAAANLSAFISSPVESRDDVCKQQKSTLARKTFSTF